MESIMRITNREVECECKECQEKYSALGFERANIVFAYEFQGYVASMVEQYGIDIQTVYLKVTELMVMLREANK
jgi:hypothetical protein